ncbi:hypothetical protein RRU01S_15_01020 [Agrobacterium rubi TR3 = NBRC 13261]|uniref:Uncharacterized protein n=1 Tax=Agrobacterium rubi TR3 = NBRC 13261 TaxID=1368415 RepID=A0A081CWY1_9HYPH|nr:hypothetical protein [Agrobacterium rubi]MBP1878145.1 hypothetical protein [Agrobacterium rubi]GAK71177.1 hypothetical protein RRU01S_15_01020 [Agrobacterium rubi TR3 = NBRC 13261]
MVELFVLDQSDEVLVRLEAAKLCGKRQLTKINRLRELERQLILEAVRGGAKRWEAIKRADEFAAALGVRLAIIEERSLRPSATVLGLPHARAAL